MLWTRNAHSSSDIQINLPSAIQVGEVQKIPREALSGKKTLLAQNIYDCDVPKVVNCVDVMSENSKFMVPRSKNYHVHILKTQ